MDHTIKIKKILPSNQLNKSTIVPLATKVVRKYKYTCMSNGNLVFNYPDGYPDDGTLSGFVPPLGDYDKYGNYILLSYYQSIILPEYISYTTRITNVPFDNKYTINLITTYYWYNFGFEQIEKEDNLYDIDTDPLITLGSTESDNGGTIELTSYILDNGISPDIIFEGNFDIEYNQ